MIISYSRDRANAAGRQSVDDSPGTAGSDAGVTSPDEALVGRAVLCTPNERCQGAKVCLRWDDGAHPFDSAQGKL
jgi:hypothetical protein